MKDKRGFVDSEVFMSLGFWILVAMSVGATVMGYVMSKKMDYAFETWKLLVIIFAEIIVCYFFIERNM